MRPKTSHRLQWEMAKKLADFSQKTFIAGDDDQAVHRWTGVNVDLFINASDDVEVLKAVVPHP